MRGTSSGFSPALICQGNALVVYLLSSLFSLTLLSSCTIAASSLMRRTITRMEICLSNCTLRRRVLSGA
jgi:hypothetical protein